MTIATACHRTFGLAALASTVCACAAIWVLVSDPAAVTLALAERSVEPVVRALLLALGTAIRQFFQWV